MKMATAIILGTLTCWVVSVLIFLLDSLQRVSGPPIAVRLTLMFSSTFAGIFFVSAVVLFAPAFHVFATRLGVRSRAMYTTLGVILSIAPIVGYIYLFWESEDPSTVAGFVAYWVRVPGEALGLLPFALGGGVLGLLVGWAVNSDDRAVQPKE